MIVDLLMLAQVADGTMVTNIIVRAKDVPSAFQEYAVPLVAVLLVLLALLFWLITNYSHILDQTSYLSGEFFQSMYDGWESRLTVPIRALWEGGRFHQDLLVNKQWLSELPEGERQPVPVESIAREWLVLNAQRELYFPPDPRSGGNLRPGGTLPPGVGPPGAMAPGPEEEQRRRIEEEVNSYLRRITDWRMNVLHPEAHRRYMAQLEQAKQAAQDRSKKAVGDMDQATLRGRGPEFVLQFTAVVVIIFATLSLAILDRLSSEQAGTILAAIAGYVLGQSSRKSAAQPDKVVVTSNGKEDQPKPSGEGTPSGARKT